LAFHWTRLIDILHCAESIKGLLDNPGIVADELLTQGEKHYEGIGLIQGAARHFDPSLSGLGQAF